MHRLGRRKPIRDIFNQIHDRVTATNSEASLWPCALWNSTMLADAVHPTANKSGALAAETHAEGCQHYLLLGGCGRCTQTWTGLFQVR